MPQLVQTLPRLHLYDYFSIALFPGVLARLRQDGIRMLLVAPLVLGPYIFPRLCSMKDFHQRRPNSSAGLDSLHLAQDLKTVGLALEADHLVDSVSQMWLLRPY